MEFIEQQREIEKIIEKYHDIIGNEAKVFNSNSALQSSDKNLDAIKQLEEKNRLLQIGVIGRVKAGKSSLLNALLFDGKPVLPKAATPMTAALTVISYGEKLSAEVDFFTASDIENIKNKHAKYKTEKKRILQEKFESLKEKRLKKKLLDTIGKEINQNKLTEKEERELKEKAERVAINELKSQIILAASFEQYEKIMAFGITDYEKLKNEKSSFTVSSYSELSNKLLDYVGADGKYMPFTKSIHIKIPNESLKDIQIVDTPGINDPVQSREARTRELLKFCDVVLIISPSGQFLSREDTELMDRITSKEGVRELLVVASQVDNQLSGSIKRDSGGDLHRALSLVISQLSAHMNSTLSKLKDDHPEIGITYDQLIGPSKERIIHSSAICKTIASFWDTRNEWDSGTQTAWNNLVKHYPDYFSDIDKQLSLSNLEKLANISAVNAIIEKVKFQKDKILSERKKEFLNSKMNSLRKYQKALLEFIERRLREINETNIAELGKNRKELQKIKNRASVYLDETYSILINKLNEELEKSLIKTLKNTFEKAKKGIDNAEGRETESWTTGHLWWKEKHSKTYTTIRTGAVRDALESLTSDIENTIELEFKRITNNWRENLPKKLIKEIRTQVNDEYLEVHKIMQAIGKVFRQTIDPDITYSGKLPDNLSAIGTLKGNSADKFIYNAQNYRTVLKSRVKKDASKFISELTNILKAIKLSRDFFTNYDEILQELEEQITNKKITIDTFNRLTAELKEIG